MATAHHTNVKCDHCGICPVIGIRFKCGNCIDYDLCQTCISERKKIHEPSHCFLFLDSYCSINASNPPLLRTVVFPPAAAFELKQDPVVTDENTFFSGSLVDFVNNSPPSQWKATTVGVTTEGNNGQPDVVRRLVDVEKRFCSSYVGTPPKIILSPEDQDMAQYAINQAFFQINDNNINANANNNTIILHYGETELMVYTKGGHFSEHMDRIRTTAVPSFFKRRRRHVGNLLFVGFSPDAIGGELVCCSSGNNIWVAMMSKTNNPCCGASSSSSSSWQWKMCVLKNEEKHKVNQLQHGFRINYKQTLWVDDDASSSSTTSVVGTNEVEKSTVLFD